MRKSRAVLLVLAVAAALPAASAQPPGPALDAKARAEVIDGLLKKIGSVYVFPDVAEAMGKAVRDRQARKEYEGVTSGPEFARLLTEHLQAVSKDGHLGVEYSAEVLPDDEAPKPPTAEELRRFREDARRRNYQYRKVERLDGGVGLLRVDGFYPGEWVGETAAAASAFLANGESVILDLRQNGGGAPTGVVLLCSYFFDEETRLSDHVDRSGKTSRQYWTYPTVPGPRLADKDLYILTSRRTFSAPESLAYDLQALKRATVVGEATGGGAHGATPHRVADHFRASIPFSRSVNPRTGTDWEGTGVQPDVAVPADHALLTAHVLALKKSLARHADDRTLAEGLTRDVAVKQAELDALKAKP